MKPVVYFLLILATFSSCRKIDVIKILDSRQENPQRVVETFFNVKDSINEELISLIYELKSAEQKKGFIYEFSKVNGFPIWEKSIGNFKSSKRLILNQKSDIESNKTNSFNDTTDFISFIPLRDTLTNEIQSYIFCDKTSRGFRYKLYNKNSILNSKPESLKDIDNKGLVLSIFSFFERDINNKSKINFNSKIYNFDFTNVTIKFESGIQNQISSNSAGTSSFKSNSICVGDGDMVIQWGNLFGDNPCAPKYIYHYTCYNGTREVKPGQTRIEYPCGKILDGGSGANSSYNYSGISNLFLLGNFLVSSPGEVINSINQFQSGSPTQSGSQSFSIPDNWQIDYSTLWLPSNSERGGGDPRQRFNYLNNDISDVTLRNSYKFSYAELEWQFYNQPVDEFTFMSSSEFFDNLATGNYTSFPTPITILLKAGATGAADLLFQMLIIRLTNPAVHSFQECLPFIDWIDVGTSTFMGAFRISNPYIDAAIAGATLSCKSIYQGESWESVGYRFIEGFLSSLAGTKFNNFINSKFAGNVSNLGSALVSKFGNYIPYSKITNWLGGGLQQISKSFTHILPNGGDALIITSERVMKGWDPNKIAVIGRNMDERVKPFANYLSNELGISVHHIQQWSGWSGSLTIEQNKQWIKKLKEEGYTIYDLGVDIRFGTDRGAYYGMEVNEIFGN